MSRRHIFLNGFMGVGKTTVGPFVAKRLSDSHSKFEFVDLDTEIEREAGASVSEIFETDGEEAFRDLEARVFESVVEGPAAVVALGGGALLDPDSRDLAETSGWVYTLTCGLPELERRLAPDGSRPLLRDRERVFGRDILKLMDERASIYEPYPVVSSDRLPDAVAEDLWHQWQRQATFQVRFPGFGQRDIRLTGGDDLAAAVCHAPPYPTPSSRFLVTDRTIRSRHSEFFDSLLGVDEAHELLVAEGERSKSLDCARELYAQLVERGADRDSLLIAVGGGSICDLTGFVAGTYMRGIDFLAIPTTLLAQVDAAIGGKTGVDFEGIKNLVGTFTPPYQVLVDPMFLSSLSPDQLRQGVAEIIKIGFVRDPDVVDRLEEMESIHEIPERDDVVRSAIRNKVTVVNLDPREETGLRALLNFGHTVGHALESLSEYTISHGVCVAIGMAVEARLAQHLGMADREIVDRLVELLERMGLPVAPRETQLDDLMEAMHHDKKATWGEIHMVMLDGVGSASLETLDEAELRAFLREQPGVQA